MYRLMWHWGAPRLYTIRDLPGVFMVVAGWLIFVAVHDESMVALALEAHAEHPK